MERVNINLLPTKTRFQLSQIKLLKQAKLIAMIVVGIWLSSLLIVGGLKLFLDYRLKNLNTQKNQLNMAVSEFSPQTELQQILRFRLKLVAEVLENRPEYSKEISRIISVFPEGTRIERLKIEGRQIEIQGTMLTMVGVKEFEEKILVTAGKEYYQSAKLKSLSSSKGNWAFSLTLIRNTNLKEDANGT